MMRSKTPLALMEQMVMVLVFALAAAICVQAFVLADRISGEQAAADQAILEAQNAAEMVKYNSGDLQAAVDMFGGTLEQDLWILPLDDSGELTEKDNARTRVLVQRIDSPDPYLGRAKILVERSDRTEILTFETAWQQADEVAE